MPVPRVTARGRRGACRNLQPNHENEKNKNENQKHMEDNRNHKQKNREMKQMTPKTEQETHRQRDPEEDKTAISHRSDAPSKPEDAWSPCQASSLSRSREESHTPVLRHDGPNINPSPVTNPDRNYSVHVRGVPASAWRNARQCALLSGVSFKDFVIHLLQTSNPIRVGAAGNGRQDTTLPITDADNPANGTAIAPTDQIHPDHDDADVGDGPRPRGQNPAPTPRHGRAEPL